MGEHEARPGDALPELPPEAYPPGAVELPAARPWWTREPVRVRVYTALTLLSGYLVTRGVLTGNDAAFVAAILVPVLGVPAVESARARVTPTR